MLFPVLHLGSPHRHLGRVLRWLACAAALAAAAAATAHPGAPVDAAAPIRFGILPLGGVFESRNDWEPVLADLGHAMARPVSMLSVGSYESLAQAIARGEIDMAFLSGRMALDAVTRHRMKVVAQVARSDGLAGYRALLLTRRSPPFDNLPYLLDKAEDWRLARGESQSMSGFIVPQLQLFLPNGIQMQVRFRSELIGTHQATALAVANGQADVATNNTADFARFRLKFPEQAQQLQVIWQSELIPHAQIVIRSDESPAFQARVRDFLTGYGRGKGPRADNERARLKTLHDFTGFVAADDSSLLPAARLAYELARQSALTARWIDEPARLARLARIEREYAAQLAALRGTPP